MSTSRVGPQWSLAVALAVTALACGGGNPSRKPDGDADGSDADGGDSDVGDDAGPDGDSPMEGPATGPATALEFCTTLRELGAALTARCNGGAPEDWMASADAFVTCAEFADRVAAGRITYHRELAQACVDAFGAQRGCFERDDLCFSKVLEGATAYGKPCKSDYDCPADGVCWPADEFAYNACALSTCTKVPTQIGDSCADLGFCFGVSCVESKCVANATLGQDCDDLKLCAPGSHCDINTAKCVPRSADGACQADHECLPTHACIGSVCKPRLALGTACVGAETACTGFTACNQVSGVCEPAGHVGQPCAGTDGNFYLCINGTCRLDNAGVPMCNAKGAVGARCASGDQCVSEGCDNNGRCAVCP